MPPKFTAAATTSSPASGQMDAWWVTITLSMICRCTSGITAVATVAKSAPVIATITVRR